MKDFPLDFKNLDDKKIAFEQYRILTESLNKSADIRSQSNNFWTTINGAAISAIAYIKDTDISFDHKISVLWTILIFGLGISISWMSHLSTLAKQIRAKNNILMQLEEYFPIPLFKNILTLTHVKHGNSTLTLKEMMAPLLFISGYLFFAFLLFFFTHNSQAPS